VERKLTGATHFLGYKITGIAIVFISVIAMVFLWLGENCGNLFTQVIFTLLSLFMAYYMFLVGHMKEHDSITGEYDDQEYLKSENNRIEETQNKLEDASEYDTKGGKIAI
jgi:fatty acid desaturase